MRADSDSRLSKETYPRTVRTVEIEDKHSCDWSYYIANPFSWSAPRLLFSKHPDNVTAWIDFWVICDETRTHLFFTRNNGHMWRAETRLTNFPGRNPGGARLARTRSLRCFLRRGRSERNGTGRAAGKPSLHFSRRC